MPLASLMDLRYKRGPGALCVPGAHSAERGVPGFQPVGAPARPAACGDSRPREEPDGPRHTQGPAYRCYLPVLAGFTGSRCAESGPPRGGPMIPRGGERANSGPVEWPGRDGCSMHDAPLVRRGPVGCRCPGVHRTPSAIDGRTVALAPSGGLDYGEMVRYGRAVAGRLRALTFQQRAACCARWPAISTSAASTVCAVLRDGRDAARPPHRHRRRDRHGVLLCIPRPPRTARRAHRRRRPDGATLQAGQLRRAPRADAVARRRGAHQRL